MDFGVQTENIGGDIGIECYKPFKEKGMENVEAMREWFYGKIGGRKTAQMMTFGINITMGLSAVMDCGEDLFISNINCLNDMNDKVDEKIWSISSFPSPYYIFICHNISNGNISKENGVFLSLNLATREEKVAFMRYGTPERVFDSEGKGGEKGEGGK